MFNFSFFAFKKRIKCIFKDYCFRFNCFMTILNYIKPVEYLIDWYFNKEFTMQYNSTVGNWTGLTPAGLITASQFNEDKFDVEQRKAEKQLTSGTTPFISSCKAFHNKTRYVYDFYPEHILVTWYLNGQEVTEGVTISEVMTNGDCTYQVHSYLECTPILKDRVTCTVEHVSLKEPKSSYWGEDRQDHFTGGVCALIFGALTLSLGLIYYRRKTSDPNLSGSL
uniref:Rano class II histocompatibility antigen, A beta chain-like n=1 Tax=Haplochromis burtoni TaxID=8153 RepID=A0A3Q2X558_HAPBU